VLPPTVLFCQWTTNEIYCVQLQFKDPGCSHDTVIRLDGTALRDVVSGLDVETCVNLTDGQVTRCKRLESHVAPVDISFTMRYLVSRMLLMWLVAWTKKPAANLPQACPKAEESACKKTETIDSQ